MSISSKKTTSKTTTTPNNPSWLEPQVSSLAGQITDLSKMDPYRFTAGPNALQTQAYGAAGALKPQQDAYAGASGLFHGLIDAPASQYDPATVRPNSILPNLSAYMSPYLQQVVDTSLADYDFGAAQTRAQNKLALANDETFGGSGGSVQTAISNDAIDRGRGALSGQLREQGFQTGANLANLDADRRQQAQLANQAAFNQARQFNAQQMEAALGRQQAAGRDLIDMANTYDQTQLAQLNAQAQVGDMMQKIDQAEAAAPLSTIAALVGAYGGLPLSLLHGETTVGKTKETGSLLDAIGQLQGIAGGSLPFGSKVRSLFG